MANKKSGTPWLLVVLICVMAVSASAQSFRVQCPPSTITHPNAANNNSEPAYTGPTYTGTAGFPSAPTNVNGAIKCQQISGGDGYATMGDGTQTYMFSFGPLSGLNKIANGLPGTDFPMEFNQVFPASPTNFLKPGDPATTGSGFNFDGAVGLANNIAYNSTIYDISEIGNTVTVVLNAQSRFAVGDQVIICGTGTGPNVTACQGSIVNSGGPYDGIWTVTAVNVPNATFPANFAFQFTDPTTGLPDVLTASTATVASVPGVDGHVDPRQIMDIGVMNGNIPAPLFAIDEDDEFFLTLTNVGMIMRPDLFEQHTVHFHGYPNASSFYDGVPDASVAINIGGSFTYYYLAPDAGTYFWHCHITPPEHLQMGMVGQLYVRPRQNRVPQNTSLYTALQTQQNDLRTACSSTQPATDILCSNPLPVVNTGASAAATMANEGATTGSTAGYAYNDGDGSTYYDVEYPLQMHGFDPNFHFVGMTFNPEGFSDMKDKYFMLNGRSYPDTVTPGPLQTQSSDGVNHYSQPLPSIISLNAGQRALLRISDLNVSEYHTLASLGIPMHVIGYNAKLLRDQAGNNTDYYTNSITLGGGESLDVILDSCLARSGATCTTLMPTGTYFLYTTNLDHLSNDAENFGGMMTEIHIIN